MNEYCVGIDLGTTNTLCATWIKGDNYPKILPIKQPIINNFERHSVLPSVLAVHKEKVLVGPIAKDLGRIGGDVILSIKRRMGTQWYKKLGSYEWTPEKVSACILSVVKKELDFVFGCPPKKILVTVPASFGAEARRATFRAAGIAGFDLRNVQLFDEPAAALLYQLGKEKKIEKEGASRYMMIDIGGGTLDVSLIELKNNKELIIADLQGRSRYNELAGDDVDLNIAGLLLGKYEQERGPVRKPENGKERQKQKILFSEMLKSAEEAKKRISEKLINKKISHRDQENIYEQIIIRNTPDGKEWISTLSLPELKTALQEFFPFSKDRRQREEEYSFFKAIQQCIDSAKSITGSELTDEDIDRVYIAGGSSSLPMIPRAVQKILYQRPVTVEQPLLAIALGAAWFAGILSKYRKNNISIQERLFDGLYLAVENGGFVELISAHEIIPIRNRKCHTLFLPKPDSRIIISLYSGVGTDDPSMVPLEKRRAEFKKILPTNQPVDLYVGINHNRQVNIELSTQIDNKVVKSSNVEISTAFGWEREDNLDIDIPQVNVE